jgi:hypothetical protein
VILEEISPQPGNVIDLAKEDLSLLKIWYPRLDGFRLNYVVSNTERKNSDSALSTNNVDRVILRFIRSQSDLIVTTGLTARTENLKASKFAPLLILTSTNEEFEFPAVKEESEFPVYTTQALGTYYPNSKALAIGRVGTSLGDFLSSLILANNFNAIALETGVTVSKALVKDKLVNEICLSVTNCSSRSDADELAQQFLTQIGLSSAHEVQVLKSNDSWFFRFDSLESNHQ